MCNGRQYSIVEKHLYCTLIYTVTDGVFSPEHHGYGMIASHSLRVRICKTGESLHLESWLKKMRILDSSNNQNNYKHFCLCLHYHMVVHGYQKSNKERWAKELCGHIKYIDNSIYCALRYGKLPDGINYSCIRNKYLL